MTVPQPDPERIARWTLQLCQVDSTTGQEAALIPLLTGMFRDLGARVLWQTVEGGRRNLLATWGDPKLLFSTHLDTVPPYLPPRREAGRLWGRGTCDAKGILATMMETIRLLLAEGRRDLAFLGVVGEETDSLGARIALDLKRTLPDLLGVINGEPTGNVLATGQRGSAHLCLRCRGRAAHSGTPEEGLNAAFPMFDWISDLRRLPGRVDPVLGPEVWNLGTLKTGRAINVVPDEAETRLFARTVAGSTFVQDVQRLRPEVGEVDVLFERGPEVFPRLEGFPTAPVPFGSDAPTLRNLARSRFVVMTGPGSIRVAHTEDEFLDLAEAVTGARQYLDLTRYLLDRPQGSDYVI
ncbi:M20 family metallopeptidase [Geothrix edaphica]|uniref:Acetylornithine deacetylase n=1 Tax=Geothrix edaphica TaxID=2927976 RepID=A0ABQ5PXV1_9BACT|nr:M20/M25/M40 family metallo-hydrolase [Geothrix edaphica]GLH67297.1 acetylornithine deacetylase [Geothrix edaphica]